MNHADMIFINGKVFTLWDVDSEARADICDRAVVASRAFPAGSRSISFLDLNGLGSEKHIAEWSRR